MLIVIQATLLSHQVTDKTTALATLIHQKDWVVSFSIRIVYRYPTDHPQGRVPKPADGCAPVPQPHGVPRRHPNPRHGMSSFIHPTYALLTLFRT